MSGNAGNDTFRFGTGDQGDDTIADFESGDIIDLSALSPGDLSDLVLTQSGADVVIDLSAYGGGSVTLLGVQLDELLLDHDTASIGRKADDSNPPENPSPPPPKNPTPPTDAPMHIQGTNKADVIDGKGGNDKLAGKKGDDVIDGGAGNDRITGGQGDDSLTGGSGNDKFWYGMAGAGHDTITDFTVGEDRIDVKAFNLSWSELLAATQDDGDGNTVITLAHPSNAAKDASITLEGVVEADLSAGDFLL